MVKVSVIICTHNPRDDIFRRVLDALDRQTLPREEWELVVVDNASSQAVVVPAAKVLREEKPGLIFARCRGIVESMAPLIVFVDDDNFLDAGYLAKADQIAQANPRIGAFGGITEAVLEDASFRMTKLLPFLGVRDNGGKVITSRDDKWGKHEPIGAGMVVRREVAEKFVEFVSQSTEAQRLDRSGSGMMSGSDSLLARCAYRLGLDCSYQPGLRLDHFIKASRLNEEYLRELLIGHGRSRVLLERAMGKDVRRMSVVELYLRRIALTLRHGKTGAIWWRHDLGYYREAR